MVARMVVCLDKQMVPYLELRKAAKKATLQVDELDEPKVAQTDESWVRVLVVSMAAKRVLDWVVK